ncbi:unnamed protein product [Ectocarpus sp. 12 AP-2014]
MTWWRRPPLLLGVERGCRWTPPACFPAHCLGASMAVAGRAHQWCENHLALLPRLSYCAWIPAWGAATAPLGRGGSQSRVAEAQLRLSPQFLKALAEFVFDVHIQGFMYWGLLRDGSSFPQV